MLINNFKNNNDTPINRIKYNILKLYRVLIYCKDLNNKFLKQ